MPETGKPPVDSAKAKKHREQILVGVGILSLLIMYMLFKRKSSSTATTTMTTSSALSQYQQQTQGQLATLAAQVRTLDYAVAGHMGMTGSGYFYPQTNYGSQATASHTTTGQSLTTATGSVATWHTQYKTIQEGAGLSLVRPTGNPYALGSLTAVTGSLLNVERTYTQTMHDIISGQTVGYVSPTGKYQHLKTVSAFAQLESGTTKRTSTYIRPKVA